MTEGAELIEYDWEEWKELMYSMDDLNNFRMSIAVNKLAEYEDLNEKCIEATGCGLEMLQTKHAEFIDDISELYAYRNTGLTPGEIKDHEEMFAAYRHVCGGKSPEEIRNLIDPDAGSREEK